MSSLNVSHYLLSVELLRDKVTSFDQYPFCLDIVRNLEKIEFHPKVTFIIGENGSGKSTLLEAIATAYGFNPEGGTKNFNFSTRPSHSLLYKYLRAAKSYNRAKDGFFLRAESFYNVASNIDQLDEEPSFGPPIKDSYGGKSLHQQSHGESFFSLMIHRFSGSGLYILDEPEAALSPTRQMAMITRLHQLIGKKSQFIIATHSPIILAYPNAKIYEINSGTLNTREYEETEHFRITKSFINSYEKFVKELTC
ncbi:MAG: AAA family ATPase [Acidiferrobacterales bacterium]|nr:AAA family ATPase [Acidiferrobacterales bacterium]